MADSRISFKTFCDVCEKIQTCSKFADKEKVLLDFIHSYKEIDKNESTFYPALRLLVPEYERERTPYGLKETSFSKLYVRTLCLRGNDADQLLKYNKISSNSKSTTDFADVAFWVLRKWCPKNSSLTIADINNHLNQMSQKHADHQPREVENELSKMIKSSTAIEQKWIIRIILKSMRLGIGNDRILKVFHPDGPDLYDVCSNLSKICTTLKDITTRLHELEVEIFTPFRPMLSLHCDLDVLNKVVKGDKTFYVENKFDGERFQLHMKDGIFKYFSKNGYDYSNIYGENYNSLGLITPHLSKIFSQINSVILDGEMMGWNKKTNNFGSKGMNYDVKKLTTDNVHRPCFVIFDILLLNGRILTNKPLSTRLDILDNLFEPIKGIILKSSRLEAKTKQDLMQELNKSVDRKEEGICFKDPNSIYKPNTRKAGWWKMKLEFFDGLMTELDVIIIGGYYGEGKRKGLVSSFLLGVAVGPNDTDGEFDALQLIFETILSKIIWEAMYEEKLIGRNRTLGESPKEFYTFAKVASGFSVEEMDKLLSILNPHWEPFEKNKNPEGIIWKKEKPDCWIDPRKSIVLQIKASELIKSSDFQTDYTLRFPRVEKIRYDKPWYNCLTLSELKDLTKSNKAVEKLSGRHLTEGDIENSPTKRRKKDTTGSLIHLFDVEQKSNLLVGKEFCVLSGNEQFSKENLEVKIKEYGGRVVQFTGPNTFCTLVGNISPIIKRTIAATPFDIVKIDWIIKVLDLSSKLLQLTPEDMIVTSKKTKLLFSNRFDKYGDSFLQPATKDSLIKVMENITKEGDYLNLLPEEYINFDEEINFNNPLGLFRPCFTYFDKYLIINDSSSPTTSLLTFVEHDFTFYGGTKCDQIESFLTHVVVYRSDCSRLELIKEKLKEVKNENVQFVNEDWITECIKSKRKLAEEKFCL